MNEFFVSKQTYGARASDGTALAAGTKIYALDGSTTALSLEEGSIAIFSDRGELLVAGDTTRLADVKKVQFAMGRGYGKCPILSEFFERDSTFVKIEYENYAAPQKMVKFVGQEIASTGVGSLNLPYPIVPTGKDSLGYVAIIEIKRTDNLDGIGDKTKSYHVPIPAYVTALNQQQQKDYVVNTMVTKINADNYRCVVAAAVLDGSDRIGISLTALDYNVTFDVNVRNLLEYATVITTNENSTVAKDMVRGCGRPYQIAAIENRALAERGRTDKLTPEQWNTWTEASLVSLSDGCGYETLTIWKEDAPVQIGELHKMSASKINLKIAVEGTLAGSIPTGAWTIANSSDFKTVMNTLLPKLFGSGVYTTATAIETALVS